MQLNRLSVYQKILLLVLSIILFLGVILSSLVWRFMDELVAQQLRKRGMEIATHVAQRSANYILVEDYYSLHELVNQTKINSEDIRYIMVVSYDGRLLAHTFSAGIPQRLEPSLPMPPTGVVKLKSDEGVIYDTIVPSESGEIGFVRVGMTEEYTRNLIMSKIRNLLFVILLGCVLAAIFCWKIAFFITQPISQLARVAEAITKGHFTRRATIHEGGEVGKLALAFNEMATGLIAANQEKENLLNELEEKEKLRNILIHKLITAQEDERKRISRELHDETSQALTSLMLSMRVLAEEAEDDSQRRALLTSRDVTAKILQEIRNLAVELRPPALDDLGLESAIEKYVAEFANRYGIDVKFAAYGMEQNDNGQVAVALYRIVQEGLTNVVKHSGAKSVRILIREWNSKLLLQIEDNGIGISEGDVARARRENRLGLYGMMERAEILGGSFRIEAQGNKGTVLEVIIPK